MTTAPKGEPILVDCEGAGVLGNFTIGSEWVHKTCPMCGAWYYIQRDAVIPLHSRDDIIARINRGDFG